MRIVCVCAAGTSTTNNVCQALYWTGSAASAFDLQSVLPASFTSSVAYNIVGNTVYGVAYDTSGNAHAIAWTVPEPTSLCSIALTTGLLAARRRR